jgi:hypothetical protein
MDRISRTSKVCMLWGKDGCIRSPYRDAFSLLLARRQVGILTQLAAELLNLITIVPCMEYVSFVGLFARNEKLES